MKLLGTGSATPEQVVDNHHLGEWMDTSDEWIFSRTGISKRHLITEETVSMLTATAAQRALENAGVKAEELDLIIAPTLGGDYLTPSLACMVQKELGATCPAFDINAACTGFIYGLEVAAGFFALGKARRILIAAGEGMSRMVDWEDRATCVLFGDGAGAVVLGAEGDDLLSMHLGAVGQAEPLYAPFPQGNCPITPKSGEAPYIKMQGQDVYKFAVSAIGEELETICQEAGVAPEQVDHVLLHQANRRIIEAAQKRCKIPSERFAMNIGEYGNLSAASIPVLLDECNRAGAFKPGQLLALCGFGAGMTTGSCLLRWSK